MAVMTDSDRVDAMKKFVQKTFVEMNNSAKVSTVDVKAAVDATDAWIDANQGAYNAALPAPFSTQATTAQKTILFAYVALKRAGLI
jgi:hypothetical protein